VVNAFNTTGFEKICNPRVGQTTATAFYAGDDAGNKKSLVSSPQTWDLTQSALDLFRKHGLWKSWRPFTALPRRTRSTFSG